MTKNDYCRVIPGSGQVLTTGSASVQSAALSAQAFAVRLVATAACHVEFGVSPTATASSALIAPNSYGEVFKVSPGSKIAAIQDSAAGELSIVEVTA